MDQHKEATSNRVLCRAPRMAPQQSYAARKHDAKEPAFSPASSHGNILSFIIPGFKQQLHVTFPDARLAVCSKCKKNFKTRDMCRVRNGHTGAPWTTAYICITIDQSCLDANNKFVDKPFTVRMVPWQAYCIKSQFDAKTPVCSSCKRTNRTKSFCRERHKHRTLPWCTVYVVLSTTESSDDPKVVGTKSRKDDKDANSKDIEPEKKESKNVSHNSHPTDKNGKSAVIKKEDADSPSSSPLQTDVKDNETNVLDSIDAETIGSDAGNLGDDINEVPQSRTFLAKVSSRSITIHWLELTDWGFHQYEEGTEDNATRTKSSNQSIPTMIPTPHYMDPNHAHMYASTMGYAAQQHQNALKSRQQYFFQLHQQQHAQHQQHLGSSQTSYPPPVPFWAPTPPDHSSAKSGDESQNGTSGEAAAQQNHYHSYREHGGSPSGTAEQTSDDDVQEQRDAKPQHESHAPPVPMPHYGPVPHWPMYYHHHPPPVLHYPPELANGHPPVGYHYMAVPGSIVPKEKQSSANHMDQYDDASPDDAEDQDHNKRQRRL